VGKIAMKKKVMYKHHLCKSNTYSFNEQVLILKKNSEYYKINK